MAATFDADTLALFDHTDEVEIETRRAEGGPSHRTIIWIVVDGGSAYVRSVRGPTGRWYREVVANPMAAVHAAGRAVAVQAALVSDAATIERVSRALESKYMARWPGPTASMLRPEVLPTTLGLVPAGSQPGAEP